MQRLLAHLALLVVAVIYGCNYLVAKGLMPDLVGPSGFIVLRVIGGGGLTTGQVIGATDRGHEVTSPKVEIPDLHTTIATAMGMPAKEIITSESGRPFNVGYKGKMIPGLLS